jgi:Methyltransferase domain
MKHRLRQICEIPRMSTFAIGAMINHGVAQMPGSQAFVNVGVWHGFTFMCGIVGNPSKVCIGIDNFTQFGGPREAFISRFRKYRSAKKRFFDMDYREYFAKVHREPIGFYVYDGDHSYDNQLMGLQAAEPFFTKGCVVLVDDTNWLEPRSATMDFIAKSSYAYRILLDTTTCCNGHPTLWNGVMVLQRQRN